MLLSLHIENFALIDRLSFEFGAGLNVLTGETGAGKSIILDALDAALGGKVPGRVIRSGADRATIEATFALDREGVEWLRSQQIEPEADNQLVCTREAIASSRGCRSRYRLNGTNASRRQVQQLRDRVVEITAQGQTLQLGQPSIQREWLDLYGGDILLERRRSVAAAFTACQRAKTALERRYASEQQRLQQLDLFQYQLEELDAAQLEDPDELDKLQQEHQRLSHVVELQQQSYQVYQALYQNEVETGAAAADLLGDAEATLQEMTRYDDRLQPILELVSTALTQVEEAGREINAYGDSLEIDPQRLQEVDARVRQLKQICRKYGPTLPEAIARYRDLQGQFQQLNGGGQSIEALERDYQARQAELERESAQLTQLRRAAADRLQGRLVETLKPLAMEKVQFHIEIAPNPPASHGADRVAFRFSSNPGEPLQPLDQIASGGEMSRFLLALKACFSQVDAVETLVFDEIDVGVSGRVASAIAQTLHQLSQGHQVLCVTHQPIIAAMADRHFRVDKQAIARSQSTDVRTVVRVSQLDDQQRREELAQLASGQSAREAIAFAESLLVQADHLRQDSQLDSPESLPL